MKSNSTLPALLAFAGLLFHAVLVPAAEWKVTVHAGDREHPGGLVSFVAPKGLHGAALVPDGGANIPVQVDDSGRATFVAPPLAKGATKTWTLRSFKVPTRVQVQQTDGKLNFTVAGKPMFTYQMEAGDVPEGVLPIFKHGAHLHPVYSPSGKLVTGNHPSDHRWHRGIWMAWTDTEFEGQHPDFWNQGKGEGKDKSGEKLLAEVRFDALVKSWSGPVHGGFVSRHRFIDHNSGVAKDVLQETWEVTAYAAGSAFVIDLISTQTCAGASPLKLPKYHYGGLGVRGSQLWNPVDAVKMLTSNGDDRAKGDATKGKWVHLGGDVEGQPTGLAVLIHPGNFRFPQPLRLNPKNPQLCIAPSQDGDWSIEPGKPFVSRYRFIVSDGLADATLLENLWNDYAQPLQVSVE